MEIVEPHRPVTADDAVLWEDGALLLLDQRRLPDEVRFVRCRSAAAAAEAITAMVVRGAPAIGIAAAYGVVLAARDAWRRRGEDWMEQMREPLALLAGARPTAVNLGWALGRMERTMQGLPPDRDPEPALLEAARRIHAEDAAANRAMGQFGADLIRERTAIITHCNAGALATGGFGTALGVIRAAHARGLVERVYADETRPWLQGARLTAWELVRDGIEVSLLVDGAAAARMAAGGVGWVVVGSDRIAANGDVANKIGTYGLALAARAHGVKFMVAAPTSTIDLDCPDGGAIPIETRDAQEVLGCHGRPVAAAGADAWNPVFDVTPARLVDAIVTEKGVVEAPDAVKLAAHMAA